MELWDLYNEKREVVFKGHKRGDAIPNGMYHLVVHVWIKNKDNKYLISRRAMHRPTFPGMYECVGGSVLMDEDSLNGALRETIEEVGITLDKEKGKVVKTVIRGIINGKPFNDIMDVWLFDYDGELDLSKATTDEVMEADWMTANEIQKLFDEGKLVPTLEYFFKDVKNN